jgi:hypothetical protein
MARSPKDILAGLAFVGIGLAFAVGATSYKIGTTLQMGPGYFPFVLGGLLAVLGGTIAARGVRGGEEGPIGQVPWRAVVLLTAAIVFFGATARGLGLVPATVVAALLASLASRRTGLVGIALIAAGLTILAILIFVVGLRLRLPLLGPWIGG